MGLVAMLRFQTLGLSFWRFPRLISASFYGRDALQGGFWIVVIGLIVHLAISVFYGVVFALAERHRASLKHAGRDGLIYGVVVWAVMSLVVLPLLDPIMNADFAPLAGWWFLYHLIFGAMLFMTPAVRRELHARNVHGEHLERPAA
jgi:hypothetical protein